MLVLSELSISDYLYQYRQNYIISFHFGIDLFHITEIRKNNFCRFPGRPGMLCLYQNTPFK